MTTEDILAGSVPGSDFTTHRRLPEAIHSFFADLDLEAFGTASDDEFVLLFAAAYEALNRHHPFREGNGRAQRRFWDIALKGSGRMIDWESGQSRIHAVSRATDRGDIRPLENLVRSMTRTES